MRFDAAKTSEPPAQDVSATGNRPRLRSSRVADAVSLVSAAALLATAIWFHAAQWRHFGNRFYLALAMTLGFALAARLARGVSNSGALAGAAVAFIFIQVSGDWRMFGVLLVLFFVTLGATRAGASRKQQLMVAEGERGRSASQVMANLGIATALLVMPSLAPAFLLALAALAEVAADTTSSEIGSAFSGRTVLITSFKAVTPGTDGGVSVTGTAAGMLAALITSGCAAGIRLVNVRQMLVIAGAGTIGMVVDSVLGAAFERRGYLNNDLVNLLSTAAAAGLAWMWR